MESERQHGDDRGASPVVGVVLTVAITVVLAATVGSLVLGAADRTRDPAPPTARSAGTIETGPSVGCGDNTVRLVHEGGEPVPVEALEVVVSLPKAGAGARLVDLPVAGTTLAPGNVVGDDRNVVYDNCVGGVAANGGDAWAAGRAIVFELNAGGGTLAAGDTVEVSVVHTPSESVVARAELTAV